MSDYLPEVLGPNTYTYAIIAAVPTLLLIGWLAGKFLSTRISDRRSGKPQENIAGLKRRLDRVNIEVDVYLHQAGERKRQEGPQDKKKSAEDE